MLTNESIQAIEDGQLEIKVLDHLRIIMSVIKKLGLIKEIDKCLPVSLEKVAKITMGEQVAAMIMDTLGFIDNRLYMFSEFLENKPVERLFRARVEIKDFTDDAFGCVIVMVSAGNIHSTSGKHLRYSWYG